jgi:hypothetical protein
MIIDLEARLFFHAAIRSANVRKKIKLSFGPRLQKRARSDDVLARDDDRRLSESVNDFSDPFRMLTL